MISVIELKYAGLLKTIESLIVKAQYECEDHIDITLCNHELENYIKSLGYKTKEIRYEYKDGVFGYYGRDTGDGVCKLRISW